MSDDAPTRVKIAREIYTTEKTYVLALRILIENYYEQLKILKFLDDDTITLIFGEVIAIYKVNATFLDSLEKLMENYDVETTLLGEHLLELVPYFKMYTNYVDRYDVINNKVKELTVKNKKFKAFCEGQWLYCGHTLSSLLIRPIQRLPRYRLLITEYLKHTPQDHPDYANIVRVKEKIEEVNSHVNDSITIKKNFEKMQELNGMFRGQINLIQPNRRFIMEGEMLKVSRKKNLKRYFFLFNDILVYATKSRGKYVLHNVLEIKYLKIKDIDDPEYAENGLQLISAKKSFSVLFSSQEEKQKWKEALQYLIEDDQRRKSTLKLNSEDIKFKGAEAPVWVEDKKAASCMICKMKFTNFRRRHHCRKCGAVVCGKCSNYRMYIPNIDEKKKVRVCSRCYEAAHGGDNDSSPPQPPAPVGEDGSQELGWEEQTEDTPKEEGSDLPAP